MELTRHLDALATEFQTVCPSVIVSVIRADAREFGCSIVQSGSGFVVR